MKLKNKTKKILKNENRLKEYNKLFAIKETRFLLTQIIGILNPEADAQETAKLEKNLVKNDPMMFIEGSKKITQIAHNKTYKDADWESFGKYLYFVFQTGVFYKNKKNGVKNIFINANYNKLNIEKKMLFNDFVESVKPLSTNHNDFIIKILKVVL